MVFAAFMQHCIQSTVSHLTHVERVKMRSENCTLYTGPLVPARREGYLLQYLKSLLSLGFSGSPPVSPRRQLC